MFFSDDITIVLIDETLSTLIEFFGSFTLPPIVEISFGIEKSTTEKSNDCRNDNERFDSIERLTWRQTRESIHLKRDR